MDPTSTMGLFAANPFLGAGAFLFGYFSSQAEQRKRNNMIQQQGNDVLSLLGLNVTGIQKQYQATETAAERKLSQIADQTTQAFGTIEVMAGASGFATSERQIEAVERESQRIQQEIQEDLVMAREMADLSIQQSELQSLAQYRELRSQKKSSSEMFLNSLTSGLGFATQTDQLAQGIKNVSPDRFWEDKVFGKTMSMFGFNQ